MISCQVIPRPTVTTALLLSPLLARAGAAITALRERLKVMGFHGLDTLGFLKSIQKSGCGVPPQSV